MAELIASLSRLACDDLLLECCREFDCDDVDGRLESSDVVLSSKVSNWFFLSPNVLIAVLIASFSTVSSSDATRKLLVDSSNLKAM